MPDKNASISALIKNAERLQIDANILYTTKSYPSCMALFISSIEQCNEAIRRYYNIPFIKKIHSKHSNRHIIGYFSYFIFMLQCVGIDLDEFSRMLTETISKNKTDEDKNLELMTKFENLCGKKLEKLERLGAKNISEGLKLAASFDIERLRQKSIYVDIENNYTITSLPSEINRKDVDELRPLFTFTLSLAKVILKIN